MIYISKDDVEAKLGRSLSANETEYYTKTLVPMLTSWLERTLQTQFGSDTETSIYVSGDGSGLLIIPTMHSITGVSLVDDDDTTSSIADFVKYPRDTGPTGDKYALKASNSGSWTEGYENYKITGKVGYTTLPDDLKGALVEVASSMISSMASSQDVKSEKVGDWQITYQDVNNSISDSSEKIIASYKRLSRSI